MPSKKVYVREYTVRAHTRTIHTRNYQLVCQFCHDACERETYATACPKYGNQCGGVAAKCKRLVRA